jgi:prepilin-type N-terminal cleavage/methylation domain-containing protein
MRHSSRGYSLPEILTVIAIIGICVMAVTPAFFSMRQRMGVRIAAAQMRAIFARVRITAIARHRHVAVKFLRIGNAWQYAVFEDGNGNGVRNAEITSGVDRLLEPYRIVLNGDRVSQIGLPLRAIPDPSGSGSVSPTASAVRFNNSTLCSFTPLGTATSGSIFLTDGREGAAALIVNGPSARIRVVVLEGTKWKRL